MAEENVIKFTRKVKERCAPSVGLIKEISLWRNALCKAGLIGKDPCKYGGLGYGNISQRLSLLPLSVNKRRFIITGSQTGHLETLNPEHYAIVHEYYPNDNLVFETGIIGSSSESLTHGAIYNLEISIGSVIHCHSPEIWNWASRLGIPVTKKGIEGGTPEMAAEVSRLYEKTNLKEIRLFAMGGHEDGIFSFGRNPEEATTRIFKYLSSINSQFAEF